MISNSNILSLIKQRVRSVEPDARIILFGSFARGDNRKDSDIDLLILLSKDKVTFYDEKNVSFPLYDLEFDSGQIISPIVFAVKDWENRHKTTPLYENINKEGIEL